MATKKKLLEAAAGAAGGDALNVEQVFSTYLYEGNGGSQVIENEVNLGQSNSGGAAKFNNNNTIDVADSTDFAFGGGDWTVEAFAYPLTNDDFVVAGWGEDVSNRFDFGWQQSTFPRIRIGENGVQYEANASTSYDISNYLGTWVHLAAVRNGNTVTLYLNGTSVASVSYSEAGFPTPSTAGIGIGSRWYTTRTNLVNPANGYISNFRIVKGTAVYTSNFTVPTSALTAITNTSLLCLQGDSPLSDNSGNSHTLTQNQYNTADVTASTFGPFDAADAGEGGLVWIKSRTDAFSHVLFDTERGFGNYLVSSSTGAQNASGDLGWSAGSFNSNGFTTVQGTNGTINGSGSDFASWTFRKAPKFFDVVTYSGTGSAQAIAHSLNSTVGMILVKRTDSTANWSVYHRGANGGTDPEDYYGILNLTDEFSNNAGHWNDTAPTTTQFTVGNDTAVNASGGSYVAYLFAHNDGDGDFGDGTQDIIKCGSYTGNGSTSGPSINLGFEPQWVLIKNASTAQDWLLIDNLRRFTDTGNLRLWPNLLNAESQSGTGVYPTSTGFSLNGTQAFLNENGSTFIYMAIRRGPMAVPESATDVFDISDGSGTVTPLYKSSFPIDMGFEKNSAGVNDWQIYSRLTERQRLQTNTTGSEVTVTAATFDFMNGYKDVSTNVPDYYAWMWKRAPNYFDVVAFELGNGTNREVKHNLNATPEIIWWKKRSGSSNWAVFHKDLGQSKYLLLQDTAAEATISNIWGTSSFSSSAFYLDETQFGLSGDDCIAYLFASLDGISKVGSYTGNAGASTINVDCGFTNGARFVLIKETSGTGDWWVFDTARGLVAGNDPALKLNTTDAELSADFIDPYSAGFSLQTNSAINTNGATFIFYAIA